MEEEWSPNNLLTSLEKSKMSDIFSVYLLFLL
jgi:hypothetical protein